MAEETTRDQLPSDFDGDEEICATIHFCSTGPELDELPPQVETEHHDGAAAVVRCEQLWKGRERLKVYFMNTDVLVSWHIGVTTPQQTLDWANEAWSKSNVPQFIVCDSQSRADIRVKFAERTGTNSEGCWSMVGTHAARAKKNSPTMVLDLTDQFIDVNIKKDQFRRSLVIHEFGHALGLEHEHQRSDLWEVLDKYIDKEKMNDSNRVSTKSSDDGVSTFGMDWKNKKFKKKGKKFTLSPEYDPQSIMHYGFELDWLKDERLRRRKTLEKIPESEIPEEVKVIIRGLHDRQLLAEKPSEKDLKYLEAAYAK